MATYQPFVASDAFSMESFNNKLSGIVEDFNSDNAKIDAALAAKSRVAVGIYVGNGTTNRSIALDFAPKAVLVVSTNYQFASTDNKTRYGGLALAGHPVYAYNNKSLPVVTVTENGFTVTKESASYFSSNYAANSNIDGETYRYLAFA